MKPLDVVFRIAWDGLGNSDTVAVFPTLPANEFGMSAQQCIDDRVTVRERYGTVTQMSWAHLTANTQPGYPDGDHCPLSAEVRAAYPDREVRIHSELPVLILQGQYLHVDGETITQGTIEHLQSCGQPGDNTNAVEEFRRLGPLVAGDPDDCAGYLRSYGTWDESELADHDSNIDRLIWLIGSDLEDAGGDGESYMEAYPAPAAEEKAAG